MYVYIYISAVRPSVPYIYLFYQERRAAETHEQRQTRLQTKCSRQSESFSLETEEQRGIRLIRLSNNQREILARESQDKHPLTIGTYAHHMNSATLYKTTDSCEILSEHIAY